MKFVFSGRDEAARQLRDLVKARCQLFWNNREQAEEDVHFDKQQVPFITTLGGPGLGKSRILQSLWETAIKSSTDKLQRQLMERTIILRVSFGNRTPLTPTNEQTLAVHLCARLLHSRFESKIEWTEFWISFCNFFECGEPNTVKSVITFILQQTICVDAYETSSVGTGSIGPGRSLHERTQLLLICIDEIQKAIHPMDEKHTKKSCDREDPSHCFVAELLSLQMNPINIENTRVLPFFHFAGITTSSIDVVITESMGRSFPILPLLPSQNSVWMAFDSVNTTSTQKYSRIHLWSSRSAVRMALNFVGGHFRSLEYFCTCMNLVNRKSPQILTPKSIIHEDDWHLFKNQIKMQYFEQEVCCPADYPHRLLSAIFFQQPPSILIPNDLSYWDNLRHRGLIMLRSGNKQDNHPNLDDGIVDMPLLFMYLYTGQKNGVLGNFILNVNSDTVSCWGDFQTFGASYVALRTFLWSLLPPHITKDCPLQTFFGRDAQWGKNLDSTLPQHSTMVTFPKLQATEFSCRRLKHKWPTPCDPKDPKPLFDHLLSSDNAYTPLTIAGKPVAGHYIGLDESDLNHVFCTCDDAIVDGFQRLNSNGLDLVILYQYKWTELGTTKLDTSDIQIAYEKVSICMSTFNPRPLWLLAIVTNTEFIGDSSKIQSNCVLVPASSKHESFFGPLTRTLESRTGKEKKANGQTAKKGSKITAQSASSAQVNKKKIVTEPQTLISAATAPSQSSPTNPSHMMASSMSPNAPSSIHFKPSSTQTKRVAPPGSDSPEEDFDPPAAKKPKRT